MHERESDVQDLREAFPGLGRGLQRLLEEEGDVEAIYSHNFEVEYDHFGVLCKVPLKPGGFDIPVTNTNREEFVQLYTQWKLHESVKGNFDAFAKGFIEVPPPLPGFHCHLLALSQRCAIIRRRYEDKRPRAAMSMV